MPPAALSQKDALGTVWSRAAPMDRMRVEKVNPGRNNMTYSKCDLKVLKECSLEGKREIQLFLEEETGGLGLSSLYSCSRWKFTFPFIYQQINVR